MKTLNQIETQIKTFQDKFGVDLLTAEQGSLNWLYSRLGVITASEVSKAVAKLGSETRNTYMCQLVAEVATGVVEEINSKYMDWGKMHEAAARASYEFANDCEIQTVGFIFKDDTFREGASLDGFIKGQNKLVEIKCPYNPTNFIKFVVEDKIKAEYMWQYQYQMRVTGADVADFVQFDPRMKVSPFKALTVERDPEYQAKFDELIPQFLMDMDTMLEMIGIKYGDQWSRLAVKESAGVA
ncbi:lambda exonuclease family protein [Bdellovibrio sp. ArHS]|uniref:lambda exonuclease family protein n=1 Tax=Bdellovibrio sp. ArHS TaxID=1569284 RepID=UPI000A7E37E2|nr:lambda exonuclease family protein [Bdellovibrio sp. ArHS]